MNKPAMQNSTRGLIDTYKVLASVIILLLGLVAFYVLSRYWFVFRLMLLSIAMGISLIIFLRTNIGLVFIEFIRSARLELRRVVWPTRSEIIQNTLVVVVMVVTIGILLWILDLVLFWVVHLITS